MYLNISLITRNTTEPERPSSGRSERKCRYMHVIRQQAFQDKRLRAPPHYFVRIFALWFFSNFSPLYCCNVNAIRSSEMSTPTLPTSQSHISEDQVCIFCLLYLKF